MVRAAVSGPGEPSQETEASAGQDRTGPTGYSRLINHA